jgi:chromate transport protein ChrA
MRLLALGNLAKQELGTALRQRGAVLAWQCLAGLCAVAIIIIGLISLHRFASELYGPYWADAILAGLFALIAVVALVVAMQLDKRAKRRQALATTMLAAAGIAAEALPDRKSTTQALVIAALAGGFWFARRH